MSADVRSLTGMRAVAYLRVSTQKQAADDKVSLADQRAAIERKAAELGVVIGAWFTDPGASGGSFEKREGMASMIASCEAYPRPPKEPGLVLVMTASRFGRPDDPEECSFWRVRFKKSGWMVRYCIGDDSDDLTTRHLMRAIGDVGATKERQEIKRRAMSGFRGAMERGLWPGGTTPFGFVRKATDRHTGAVRVLAYKMESSESEDVRLHPDEGGPAQLIRALFERYAAGTHATHALAAFAQHEWPAVKWTPSQIARMLKNRAYCGDLVSGNRAQSGEAYGCENAHEPIVSRALFEAVQARFRHFAADGRGVRGTYGLTGLVHCAACGQPLIGAGSNGRVRRGGGRSRFYRCRGVSSVGHTCHMRGATVMQEKLEGAVRHELAAEFRTVQARAAVWREIERALDAQASGNGQPSTDALDTAIRDLEKQVERTIRGVATGLYSENEAGPILNDLRARLAGQRRVRADVVRLADQRAARIPNREQMRALVDGMPALLATLSGAELRGAVSPWLRAATFDASTRVLTMEIRRVPNFATVGYSGTRAGASFSAGSGTGTATSIWWSSGKEWWCSSK